MGQEEEKKDIKIITNFEDESEQAKLDLEGEVISTLEELHMERMKNKNLYRNLEH